MKAKSTLILIITIVVIAFTSAVAYNGIGEKKFLGTEQIRLGLDLEGGVSITYEAGKDNPTAEEMESAVSLIRKRLDFNNYTESDAYREGEKRIHVEIPGVKDPNKAVADIGQTAQLRFVGIDDTKMDKNIKYKTKDEYIEAALKCGAGKEVITGADIKTASKQFGPLSANGPSESYVKLELNSKGKDKFAAATKKYKNKIIAILLDGKQISMPRVNSEITDGVAIISGMGSPEEAGRLANLIKAGALPFDLIPLQSHGVGAKLGMDAMDTSLLAGFIGAVLILIFMLAYYRIPGLAADIALVFYAAAVLVLLSAFKITLTLPGIAGIILSVGMAVDANIIIFSRIREEMRAGKGLRSSVNSGFKKALSAIVDGNVTTLIAAAVLWKLGTGPIKGFAQTLALGIFVSMFTALVVTKIILKQFINLGIKNPRLYCAK